MTNEDLSKYRVVTPEQKEAGYIAWVINPFGYSFVERRAFRVVRKLDDGSWLVHDPDQDVTVRKDFR